MPEEEYHHDDGCGLHTLVYSTLVQTVGETEASTHVHTNTHAFKHGSHMKGLTTPSPTITPHPNFKELNKKSKLLKKDGYKAQSKPFVACRHTKHRSLLNYYTNHCTYIKFIKFTH